MVSYRMRLCAIIRVLWTITTRWALGLTALFSQLKIVIATCANHDSKRKPAWTLRLILLNQGGTAYKEMQCQIYREFLYKTVDRIKKKDSNCLVTINLAYSMHMPEKPYKGIDYLTADFGNEFNELSQEAHWYDSQDKPFEIMTTAHIDAGKTKGRQPKPKGQIEQEMATILINGGRYNTWNNPDSKSAISEKIGEHLRAVVSPFLRARQPWILQTMRLPDVSLLYSATDHYAATDKESHAFLSATDYIPITDRIWQAGLNYEMLPEYKLDEGSINSKLVIVENPAALSQSNIAALRKITESVGTIMVTGSGNYVGWFVGFNRNL